MIIGGIIGLLVGLVVYILITNDDNDHPKYPPTDTLGGWD
jgi:hypothetical protein